MMNSEPDLPEWEKTRELLKRHMVAPKLEHPDFVNTRVLEAIDRMEPRKTQRTLFPLRRLVWAGVFGLLAAGGGTGIFLPHALNSYSEGAFYSQVLDLQPANSNISASSFPAPEDRGVVIWIEGTEFIPADQPVL